jgi:hypothetical protein
MALFHHDKSKTFAPSGKQAENDLLWGSLQISLEICLLHWTPAPTYQFISIKLYIFTSTGVAHLKYNHSTSMFIHHPFHTLHQNVTHHEGQVTSWRYTHHSWKQLATTTTVISANCFYILHLFFFCTCTTVNFMSSKLNFLNPVKLPTTPEADIYEACVYATTLSFNSRSPQKRHIWRYRMRR